MGSILNHYHTLSCWGHFGGQRTVAKLLQLGFYWPSLFKDAHQFVSTCDKCQRMGGISKQDEPPMRTDECLKHSDYTRVSLAFSY